MKPRNEEHVALLATRALVDNMRSRYRELEKLTGASITMHRVLACIAAQPGVSASGIATALGMTRSGVSHVLKGLIERGWIKRLRAESDQRGVHIHLSTDGQIVVSATAGRAVGALQRAIGGLSQGEVGALACGLTALLRELSAQSSSAEPSRKRAR